MRKASTVSENRPLTVKQQKFAVRVAEGKPKTVARREAGYALSPPGYEVADRRKASDLGKAPHVAAEIRRLTWLSFPQMDNTRGMKEQAVRIIADLSRTAKSEAVRLNAAQSLWKIASDTENARAATGSEQDKLLAGLRSLYKQIQATAEDPPERDPELENRLPADALAPPPITLEDCEDAIDISALSYESPKSRD